ncbi:MAG: WXG100 family type VII secretion target [Microthrixaceae bacterium]
MSITHGMNVEEVKGLERELRTHAQAIEDIKGKLNAKIDKVAGNDWKGKDASDFKDKVWAEHRKTLDRIVKDLRAAADQAKKNVVKQEDTSRSL